MFGLAIIRFLKNYFFVRSYTPDSILPVSTVMFNPCVAVSMAKYQTRSTAALYVQAITACYVSTELNNLVWINRTN